MLSKYISYREIIRINLENKRERENYLFYLPSLQGSYGLNAGSPTRFN